MICNNATEYYGFTSSASSPSFMVNTSGVTAQVYLSLPGGVTVTIRPQQTGASAQTFSLSNVHGDVFATLDALGTVLGTTVAGLFGEALSGQTLPVNGATGVSYGYVGKYLKATEAQLTIKPMQMGARVYLPGIGRFTSVDPVQGGTPNNYTYVTDPVNDFDLSGQWSLKNFVQKAVNGVKHTASSAISSTKKVVTKATGMARGAAYQVSRVAAFVAYLPYYGSYTALKAINNVGSGPGMGNAVKRVVVNTATMPIRPFLWAGEAVGLAGDIAVDAYKGRVFRKESGGESIWDEGGAPKPINPFHNGNSGPKTYLPGLREDKSGIDWEW